MYAEPFGFALMDKETDQKYCTTSGLEAAVYLLPVALSDGTPADVLPARNIEILRNLKYFCVENIRTARRFLKRVDRNIDIDSLTFTELNEHTSPADIPAILETVVNGNPLGVMSEAGCPGVADPGAALVELAQRRGIKVIPLVGPSSILLSLMASGMNGQNFTFNGYLPIGDKERESALRRMATNVSKHDVTQIFIETPYRNNKLIATLLRVLPGDMKLCIASDLTGCAESVVTRTLSEWKKTNYNFDKVPAIFLIGR